MGYDYDHYFIEDDPRFKEDARQEEINKEEAERDEDARLAEERDRDVLERELDLRETENERLAEAYNMLREVYNYNDFKELEGDLRAGKLTNEDILRLAKEESRKIR